MSNFILAMLSAIGFGRTEQYAFDHGFHPGPADFLGFFNFNYHIWMFLVSLVTCYNCLWAVPLWILVEDITYFLFNKNDQLESTDWVTGGYGGFKLFGQFIPNTYIMLLIASFIISLF